MENKNNSKCRICLIKIEPGLCQNIFKQTRIGLSVSELLSFLTSIQFRHSDGLPNSICGICEGKVNVVIDLYSAIVASDFELRKGVQESCSSEIEEPIKIAFTQEIKTEPFKFEAPSETRSVSVELSTFASKNEEKSQQNTYSCGLCLKKFTLESALKNHRKSHMLKNKMFKCHLCNKAFKKRIGLLHHGRMHNLNMSLKQYYRETNSYGCQLCSRRFASNDALQQHIKSHQSKQQVFKSRGRFYTKKKQCLCEICGKKCNTKMALKVHSRIHKKLKPKSEENIYSCRFCNTQFRLNQSLQLHVKTVHLQLKKESSS
ncbi:zinc finger protein 728-like [Tribolium madens]|uniref:zinc finger protein 728-like n=1 Tax=Tribolium madens TaxID=41895 RepID=UPI001CF75F31|nr:zinc finger protein 728-like [Tribolium madens]XP_044253900.1 zinc finger protein 728-like [Tribolium madens]XP_044253901.1 zinc finger protein 728-like [Tribolium madens]XP_044253902.1 zinc finger protein 728-like [Tribolium madens]XP_044253903.1 zinc finger protein 728-like [Tribolium madens]XP_044253904.1 zinc finger protein 728-like [Tribolium madens]XP_044253905.1 zinc finger protein 728-like [Tribolium madens]XP_044253906.1 zinc finger protein 728-like [Tribolium madens]XP_04425390